MVSKRFSFKNLIFVFTLLILAVVFGVAGGNGIVLADSRTSAKNDINNFYTEIVSKTSYGQTLVDENNYNALGRLNSIKASADYLLDNCQEAEIDSIKVQKLEELDLINDFIAIGESLKDYTYLLFATKPYTDWNKELAQGYLDAFLSLLNVEKLFDNGDLNRDYLQNTIGNESSGEYKITKENIDKVTFIETTSNLEEVKASAISAMESALEKYKAYNYYNDNDKRDLQFDNIDPNNLGAKQQVSVATLEGEVNAIKSSFIVSLQNSKTITEKVYDTYIYYSTYPDLNGDGLADYRPSDISDEDLISAIIVYQNLQKNGEFTLLDTNKFSYVTIAGIKVFEVYRNKKLEDIQSCFNREHYSDANLIKILGYIYEAKQSLSIEKLDIDNSLASQVDSIVANAKEQIYLVPKNVNTVTTVLETEEVLTKSKYKVTVTSSNPYAFSPDAFVVANDYTFYPVKVNVNRLLKKLEPTKDSNGETQAIQVKFYINITIYEKVIINGPNIDVENLLDFNFEAFSQEKLKDASRRYESPKDKNGNYTETYTVSIVMDETFDSVGEDLKVVYYYNGQMEGFSQDENGKYTLDQTSRNVRIEQNSQGEKVLMFTTNHFSPYAICGNTTIGKLFAGPFYKNPFFYIATILVAIIFIIVLFIILKHCKYKLIFVNNGGTRVKTRKFKNKELIEMPIENPTKVGYAFGGWFADKECTQRFCQTVMTRHKVKAFAKWNPTTSTCIEDYYKELRAYLDDFQKVGTGVGFTEVENVARIIISNDKVLLFVAGDMEKYIELGYNIIEDKHPENEGIHNKFVVQNEEDLEKALELIDMAMDEKGLMEKEDDLEIKEITPEERENGYLLSFTNNKVAEDLKDYLEMLRVQSKSFVMVGDGGTPRDLNGKFIVKAKRYADTIKLYLPYETEGAERVSDVLYKDVPFMYQITDAESCEKALKIISESMISLGMIKYPRNAMLLKGAGDEDTAFGYKIKFN